LDGLPITATQRQHLDFLLTAHQLTAVIRVNRLLDGSRGETSAEHSWHLALAAISLAPDVAPDVDLHRVVTMLLIHDLPEVYAGDVPIYDVWPGRRAACRIEGYWPALGPVATALIDDAFRRGMLRC
jgi:5'-deoxynucleotidase YfbR-like HD superfamily hydrolase